MTLRRRFFAANAVQQQPGRVVELEMQLRPAEGAPAAVDDSDVIGAGWLMSLGGSYDVANFTQLPDGRWRQTGATASGLVFIGVWEGALDGFGADRPGLESPLLRCTSLSLASGQSLLGSFVLVGVLQGRTLRDVRWVPQWGSPLEGEPSRSSAGHRVQTLGNMVYVMVQNAALDDGGPPAGVETLTVRAFCAGREVAQLTLMLSLGMRPPLPAG
jgi:hypothetical protein